MNTGSTFKRGVASSIPLAVGVAVFSVAGLAELSPAAAQSLRGSTRSLDKQNQVAREHDFTYIANAAQLERFVNAGYLVRVRDSRDFRLNNLSFPYARPEVKLFIQRLAAQYRRGCGEQLVVTSLTRPQNRQPRNASARSVHPTGMALDLRRPNSRCRGWLESTLLQLEGAGVLEATYERRPPHYHVVLFPRQYAAYVERRASATGGKYQVQPGDSLWGIARRHATTVPQIRSANNLRGNKIYPGQVLTLPR